MGETGCLWYDGKQIPVMNLSTKIIRCDFVHPTNTRLCVCGDVVRIECGGSHEIWTARSAALGRGSTENHPLAALQALVSKSGCTLLRAIDGDGDDIERTRAWLGKN